jgi:hypothetical protein
MATEDVKVEVKYPRWVKRDPNVGDVLVLNAEEEAKLLSEWKSHPASHPHKPAHPTEAELKARAAAEKAATDKAFADRDAEGREKTVPVDKTAEKAAADKAVADKAAERHR